MNSLDNTYASLPEEFFESSQSHLFPNAQLIKFNHELAQELGFNFDDELEELPRYFSGQKLLPNSKPISIAYAGYQFGHAVKSLGDGRAVLLGEKAQHDIQLKGSGRTPFSRRGDGFSALGPVLREYILSESMFHLGVPTTRALAAVSTGEDVHRQFGLEPGGIFTRVAKSHIRIGTFQYFYFREDFNSIKTLLDYTVQRHFPWLMKFQPSQRALEFLCEVTKQQIELIAKWSSLGFIHGVMNTDNTSICGITIDYGPCAFMDEFRYHKVFSSIDRNGRYSFFNQVPIMQWNLLRLADCLLPIIDSDIKQAAKKVEAQLFNLFELFEIRRGEAFAKKLGLAYNEKSKELVKTFLDYLEENSLDFTTCFRKLPELFHGDYTAYKQSEKLENFIDKWKSQLQNSNIDELYKINPIFVPRNHLVEKVIVEAYDNDFKTFHKMLSVLKSPYEELAGSDEFYLSPNKDQKVYQTFCGT